MTVICKGCNEKRAHKDAIVFDDYSVCETCFKYYETKNGEKNGSELKKCDIFTLRISSAKKNHYAFIEWGRAKEQGKALVVIYDFHFNDKVCKGFLPGLFHVLMKESKQSFSQYSKEIKNAIIKKHPNIEVKNYKEYKEYLKSYLNN